ncbi:MAG: hypothetical protein KGH69_02100 [Candidatus Micrarchaeota archaeon]|nr:hypothetical protein [Candidatus Micrarchaeota archaeon]
METLVLYAKLGPESRQVINMWFQERAKKLVNRASRGIFSKTIEASDVKKEFMEMAGEVACQDKKLLERWLAMRADIFIKNATRGWGSDSISAKDVEAEFKTLAAEYINLTYNSSHDNISPESSY